MDLTGLKFVSDKKQSNIDQYQFASSILQPTKMIDFPFVRLTGNVDFDNNSPARTYSSNTNNGSTLLSQAKSFKTDMVGGFVGSKSHVSTANRDTHQIWDVVIGKLNDFVQSKLVEKRALDSYASADKCAHRYHEIPSLPHNFLSSLFQDSSSPVASFILATNTNCYLQNPTSAQKSSPLVNHPAVQSPTHETSTTSLPTHPMRINISEHLSPHISSPLLIPDHFNLTNITSFPITLSKPNDTLTSDFPTELLYKHVHSIQQQPPTDEEPISEQKSYAEVAKMAAGKCRPKLDQRCPKIPKNHSGKRHQPRVHFGRFGNRSCQRLTDRKRSDGTNWRDHDSATARDVQRTAFRTPHRNAAHWVNHSEDQLDSKSLPFHSNEDRTTFHPVYSRDGLRSRNHPFVPCDDNVTFRPRDKSQPLPASRNRTFQNEVHIGTSDGAPFGKYEPRLKDSGLSSYATNGRMRHTSRNNHRTNVKPRIVHEKHPNYDKHPLRCCETDAAASCRYYDADERRCANWRCRHNTPSKSSPRRERERSFTRVRAHPGGHYSPPEPRDATIKNTLEKYLKKPCNRIAAFVSRPVREALPSASGNLSKLKDAAVEKCAEAFCATRSRGVCDNGDALPKNLSRLVAERAVGENNEKRHDENMSRDRTTSSSSASSDRSATTKRRTMSEDSDDSFVIFGVGDVEASDESDGWSDDGDETDTDDDDDDTDDDDGGDEAMACLTLELDEMCVSPRMKDINVRWQAEVARGASRSEGTKKVQFAPAARLAHVHPMVLWDYAYRTARCGPWEQMARDRERFRQRVLRSEPTLAAVLTPAHRDKMRSLVAPRQ